ncbi:MAG: DUF6553 family protein [Bilifractor sp.]
MERKQWVERYMRELDCQKRKEILDQALAEEGNAPDNELRARLLESRYGKRNAQNVDYFIRGWMSMYYVNTTARGFFARKRIEKEKASVLSDWKVEMIQEYGEIGKEVLYEELFNMTMLYFHLCETDKNYGSIILGLGHMKDESLISKIAGEVYRLAYETPRVMGAEEEFALFTKAATDAYCEKYSNQQEYLMNKVNRLRSGK